MGFEPTVQKFFECLRSAPAAKQFSVVAGLGFGPIFGILARNEVVFGIGGFEPGI